MAVGVLILLMIIWPFYRANRELGGNHSVRQNRRIEPEGLAVLPPWQKLTLFSIRSEKADIENAAGRHRAIRKPVTVSLHGSLQHQSRQVAEVFEKLVIPGICRPMFRLLPMNIVSKHAL